MDRHIRVIDSHTAGEPTRVVVSGAPPLGAGSMVDRCAEMQRSADWLRTSLLNEPRGAPWMVGALLQEPVSSTAAAGIIFFNNIGYLGMCGHGLMGVVATLAYLDRIVPGVYHFETPVGNVAARLDADGTVAVENVLSFRHRNKVTIDVPHVGQVTGDVAWGGNWFFIASVERLLSLAHVTELTELAWQIRHSLERHGITGRDGALIDHVELIGPPDDSEQSDARNFVLCPGGEYDRSPCGTGTSAKLACLAADGIVAPGGIWRQQSVAGTIFEGRFREADGGVIPTVTGKAFVNADCRLVIDRHDPFRFGISPQSLVRDQRQPSSETS